MKIVLGIPLIADPFKETFGSHLALAAEISKQASKFWVSCPAGIFPHDRARNFIFRMCNDVEADYLMFVDADNEIPTGAFTRLRYILESNSAQMVTGHYLRRGFPYTSVWAKKIENQFHQVDSQEVIEVDTCGLGCALLDLRWFRDNLTMPYCTMAMDGEGTSVTDDVSLCNQIRAKNGKILGDGTIRCGHLAEREIVLDSNADRLRKTFIEEHSNGVGNKH